MFGLKKAKPLRISLLDGPLRPNDLLEQAAVLPLVDPTDMCVAADGALLVSCGKSLLRLQEWAQGTFSTVAKFSQSISAVAARDDGVIAVGLNGGGIRVLAPDGYAAPGWATLDGLAKDVRACRFLRDGTLLLADTGTMGGAQSYKQDLLGKIGHGQILHLEAGGKCNILAQGLRYPYGLGETASGQNIICESWAARLCTLHNGQVADSVLRDAPGYPARLSATLDGGYILSMFARRDPLIEFMLSEPKFLGRMTAEIDPKFWISPQLSADEDYRLPTQMGATRLFGETKPWAPSFSYGLVIRLDSDFTPIASAQSRANGKRHGIMAALEWNGDLIALSAGSNALLNVTAMNRWI